MVQAIALTPDGTRLAVASQDDGKQGTIEVVSLANGAARTWTSSAVGLPWDLSWDASGRQLAYFWSGGTSQSGGLWLLDTDASRNDPGAVVGGIVALSAQTGLPLHTLLAVRATSSPVARAVVTSCLLSSIDATGDHLLVSCDQFGRLDRGRFTALPGADPNMVVSAAAW